DQGDADRAEFIRLQVESAQVGEDDPLAVDLDSRAEAILAESEKDWLGEWSERLVRWTFRRGFLNEIAIEPEPFLRYGKELFERFPVRRVRFVGRDGNGLGMDLIRDIAVRSEVFSCIRSLDASGSLGPADPWDHYLGFRALPSALRELSLSDDSHDG